MDLKTTHSVSTSRRESTSSLLEILLFAATQKVVCVSPLIYILKSFRFFCTTVRAIQSCCLNSGVRGNYVPLPH